MKNNISFVLLICSTFILLSISCDRNTAIDKNMEVKEEITNTISSSIGWFKDKDFDLLFNVVADDSNFIVVNPGNKIIEGFEQFKENSEIFKRPEFQYVRHELKDLKITLSNSRNVAWYYCLLDDINTWDEQPANWENARWTGVLEKRDGGWRIVQMHFSFAQ